MDPLALAAGTALVSAVATQSWEQACAAVMGFWRRIHPDGAGLIEPELAEVRRRMLEAHDREDEDTQRALAGTWQLRLQRLLEEDPAVAPELRRLLEEDLRPVLPVAEQARVQQIMINAQARGRAHQNIAGRDMHITGL
jgi:hypothetical protein